MFSKEYLRVFFYKTLIYFRFVTLPLIRSGRKHLLSSSKILANKTSTFRWLLQNKLLVIDVMFQEPNGMLPVFLLIWPGEGCWPCAGAGQSDHPFVPPAVHVWPFSGPVVPVGQVWISQSHLCQSSPQGKWQQHACFNLAKSADRVPTKTLKTRTILRGQDNNVRFRFDYNTGAVVGWGTCFFQCGIWSGGRTVQTAAPADLPTSQLCHRGNTGQFKANAQRTKPKCLFLFFRDCCEFICWRGRIWFPKITSWGAWWKARVTPM